MSAYVVIEESEVLRCGRNENHVSCNLVQFSVALRLNSMRCLERVDLQSGPRVQCEVPALLSKQPSGIETKSRSEESYEVIYVDGVFCIAIHRREVQIPPAASRSRRTIV